MKTIEIKELIQYKQAALEAMFNYLKNDNTQLLANSLYEIEIDAYFSTSEDLSMNIWFKFYKDDTLCTTIKELIHDLKGRKNRQYILDQFGLAIRENSLEVYYS